MSKNIILTNQEIEHTIKRIAYQIYETFVDEQEIVIAGIATNGFIFAKIAASLEVISSIKVSLCEVQQTTSEITHSPLYQKKNMLIKVWFL
jgi:pyrimidine operon attenuation protein/uracil phosphoribosyltransferase